MVAEPVTVYGNQTVKNKAKNHQNTFQMLPFGKERNTRNRPDGIIKSYELENSRVEGGTNMVK